MAIAAKKTTQSSDQPSARKDLIKYIAKEGVMLNLGNQEKAGKALEIVLAGIQHVLKEEKPLRFLGFGTFSVQNIAARTGRNPRTGAAIQIAEYNQPKFKVGQKLKDACNKRK